LLLWLGVVLVVLAFDLLPHRTGVERAGDPQGPRQRPTPLGEVETCRVGVQPGTSSGGASPRVGDEESVDHDHAHQVGSAARGPAPHARAHRGAPPAGGRACTARGGVRGDRAAGRRPVYPSAAL